MSSDSPVPVSSPISIRGISPLRRRSSGDGEGPESPRPNHRSSPIHTRSYEHDDPNVLERQRTMDVDMARQMARARRETITSPSSSPYEPPFSHDQAFPTMLSPNEQHEIHLAQGAVDESRLSDVGEAHPEPRNSSTVDLRAHLSPAHDPALLVTGASRSNVNVDEPPPSFNGLPLYQADTSGFNFGHMESFAAEERETLVPQTSPTTHFSLDALRRPATQPVTEGGAASSEAGVATTDPSGSPPRIFRHRKLSTSTPAPRTAKKGKGGRLALFETGTNDPLPGRLGALLGQGPSTTLRSEPSLDNIRGHPNGILNTGHDRPYRFSFYSNALSATIHARSLSELPGEGQTFEQLFTGVGSPNAAATTAPLPRFDSGPRGSGFSDAKNGFGPDFSRNGASGELEGHTWWLDVMSPTDKEMMMLSKVFSIHPLTTEDIQMEETREKIELFRNYYFVCFRSFDQDPYSPTHLEPLNMYIIVLREGIISFHSRPTPHPQNVRRRIKQLKDFINVTSDWISYALIDDITDAFGPLIQSIEYEVDSIDELVLILKEAEQTDMLRRIGTCRKKVMGLLRLMGNKADVVKGLAKRCNENWRVAPTSDIGLYLSDIQDHLITMTQNLNHYEKILSRSHSNYLAQISIEMTDANNQINDVLSKLTALGTVLIPMNLVTGLWGMNVHVPGEDNKSNYVWFISIIAGLAAFAAIGGYSTYRFMVGR